MTDGRKARLHLAAAGEAPAEPEAGEVAVLFGGASHERRVSVASAQHVAEALPGAQYWYWALDDSVYVVERERLLAHERPFERDFEPGGVARWGSLEAAVDDAGARTLLLALHGGAGEDGRLQYELELRGLAFTGSGSRASATAFDKLAARDLARRRAVQVAPAAVLPDGDWPVIRRRLETFLVTHGRVVVKPVADGSSVGVLHLRSVRDLDGALDAMRRHGGPHFAEAFVRGRELTVGVVDTPAGAQALAISETISGEEGASYEGKYLGRGLREVTPAVLPAHLAHPAERVALTMHAALGCEGYSRTDVILNGRGVTYLETNTLPGLTRASFLPAQLAAAGVPFERFLGAQLALARRRRGPRLVAV